MALRFIGDAKIVMSYIGMARDGSERAIYQCRVTTEIPGESKRHWRGNVYSCSGGPIAVRNGEVEIVHVESPEGYDATAIAAVTFACESFDGCDEDLSEVEKLEIKEVVETVKRATEHARRPGSGLLIVRRTRNNEEETS